MPIVMWPCLRTNFKRNIRDKFLDFTKAIENATKSTENSAISIKKSIDYHLGTYRHFTTF